jgi:hypothetical protein
VAQGEGPEFKPQYRKKQNKTKVDMSRMNEFIIHISKSLGKFFAQDITV